MNKSNETVSKSDVNLISENLLCNFNINIMYLLVELIQHLQNDMNQFKEKIKVLSNLQDELSVKLNLSLPNNFLFSILKDMVLF